MMHFLKTFHRIALRNVDIDVGSDVAIKIKYTH